MSFKFQIMDAAEIFRDPIGHYHHWTILAGHLLEGTVCVRDKICIPATDGTKMCAVIGGFDKFYFEAEKKDFGSEVSAGQYASPFGVMVRCPAPSEKEVARDLATGCSSEEFHELIGSSLHHKPTRLIHDRGPDGLGLPCGECTQILYHFARHVLHADFESALTDLCRHPDPYIAGRAQDIISKAMTEAEYGQWRGNQVAALRKSSQW